MQENGKCGSSPNNLTNYGAKNVWENYAEVISYYLVPEKRDPTSFTDSKEPYFDLAKTILGEYP